MVGRVTSWIMSIKKSEKKNNREKKKQARASFKQGASKSPSVLKLEVGDEKQSPLTKIQNCVPGIENVYEHTFNRCFRYGFDIADCCCGSFSRGSRISLIFCFNNFPPIWLIKEGCRSWWIARSVHSHRSCSVTYAPRIQTGGGIQNVGEEIRAAVTVRNAFLHIL